MVKVMPSPKGAELLNIKVNLYPRYREILGSVNGNGELRFALPLNGKIFHIVEQKNEWGWILIQTDPLIPEYPTKPVGVKKYVYLPLYSDETPNIGNLHAYMV